MPFGHQKNIERFKKSCRNDLQVIEPAARGDAGPASEKIEETLARLLPLAIEFLAKLVGLGDLDNKVKKILEKIQKPVNKAIDWTIDKVLQGIDWLKAKVKSVFGGKDDDVSKAKEEIAKKDVGAKTTGKDGQKTDLKVEGGGQNLDAPNVNLGGNDGGQNSNAPNVQPNTFDDVSDGAEVIDKYTDLGAKEVAQQYPSLGSTISEKERVAQKSMEENLPGLNIDLPKSNGKPTKKASIQLGKPTINDAIEGRAPGMMFKDLPKDGETLVKGAGERPTLKLGGPQDPERMNRMGAQAGTEISDATIEVAKQIDSTNVDFTTDGISVDASLDIKDTLQNVQTPQLPELESYLNSKLDDEVKQAIARDIEGNLKQEFIKVDSDVLGASDTFEQTRNTEITKAMADAEAASKSAAEEQGCSNTEAEKVQAEKINAEKRQRLTKKSWMRLNEQVKSKHHQKGKLKSAGRKSILSLPVVLSRTKLEPLQNKPKKAKPMILGGVGLNKSRMSSLKRLKIADFISDLYRKAQEQINA